MMYHTLRIGGAIHAADAAVSVELTDTLTILAALALLALLYLTGETR